MAGEPAQPPARGVPLLTTWLERWAHLGALWSLAVAAPLFALLGRHPEFLALHGALGRDFVGFALLLAFVPPLALLTLELALDLVAGSLARVFHLACIGVLCSAALLSVWNPASTAAAAVLAAATGLAAALAYARLEPFRTLLTLLAPAPLVFVALFLFASDAAGLVSPAEAGGQPTAVGAPVPVVVVIFDEFPVDSLMDSRGGIDRHLYPNFARLAANATWYRNTATVDQDTPYAVPAILDGLVPRPDRLPVAADHPRNIFTLLGRTHALHVREDATAICPPAVCASDPDRAHQRSLWHDAGLLYAHSVLPADRTRELPGVRSAWRTLETGSSSDAAVTTTRRTPRETKLHRYRRLHANLATDRAARFDNFVSHIGGGDRPYLHLIHILLPHVPYQYLPSGRLYRRRPNEALPGLDSRPGFGSRFLVEQGYQRHLLQVEATDRLLGRLLDRLHRVGVYDRALVAVVADHGISFRIGHDRRLVRPNNVRDIAPVPFLIKAPGQRHGRVSDRPLRTVDVLPTIADLLHLAIPWHVDGRSALSPTSRGQRRRKIISKKFRHTYLVDTPSYQHDRHRALARKVRLFGSDPSTFGPRPDLLGRRPGRLPASPPGQGARIEGLDDYRRVDRQAGVVPVHVVGTISGGIRGGGRVVALAVNGRIAATGMTFSLSRGGTEQFSFMLPGRALLDGDNHLEVVLARRGELVSLGPAS